MTISNQTSTMQSDDIVFNYLNYSSSMDTLLLNMDKFFEAFKNACQEISKNKQNYNNFSIKTDFYKKDNKWQSDDLQKIVNSLTNVGYLKQIGDSNNYLIKVPSSTAKEYVRVAIDNFQRDVCVLLYQEYKKQLDKDSQRQRI